MQTAQLTAACTSKGKRRGNRTSEDLEAKIRELADLPRPDLTERWRQLYRAAPPKGISRPLLTRAVAYGMQVKRYGGLKPAVRRQLRKVADGGSARAAANVKSAKIAPGMRSISASTWRDQASALDLDLKVRVTGGWPDLRIGTCQDEPRLRNEAIGISPSL